MKSVQIRNFSGPNTGKYGPEKTPYLDTFHSVITYNEFSFTETEATLWQKFYHSDKLHDLSFNSKCCHVFPSEINQAFRDVMKLTYILSETSKTNSYFKAIFQSLISMKIFIISWFHAGKFLCAKVIFSAMQWRY